MTGRPGRVVSHTESTSKHGTSANKESRHNTVRRGSFASPTFTVTPHPQKQTVTYRPFRRVGPREGFSQLAIHADYCNGKVWSISTIVVS